LRAGNRAYADGRHADALERYGRAAGRRPKDARPLYNAGAAFYRLERHDDASAAWGEVAGRGDAARAVRAGALYNLGGARYRAGDYRGAAAAYRAALALDPSDLDARRNLAVALKRLRQPPPPRSDDKKKDDQDQDKKQGGEDRPKPDKPRPQDSLTKDEAEQVMRAVAEREKAAQKDAARRAQGGRSRHPGKEDW
ncbi:MAG: tetratricopeptide repeat protein, partial [Elusimicrobiota bacterium]|nr:tetratricopeptide repeat protein [Elusimicrobiota bacterium]